MRDPEPFTEGVQHEQMLHGRARHDPDGDGPPLSAARVHLEMRILAQAIDADQSAFTQPRTLQRFSFFCAPVATRFPPSANERQHLMSRNAFTERFAQIRALSLIHISEPTRLLSISYAV